MWEMRRNAHKNVDYLSCDEVEALGYFQLSHMINDDRNVVTERVSETVLQLTLNTSTNFRTRLRVPEALVRVMRLLRWSSL